MFCFYGYIEIEDVHFLEAFRLSPQSPLKERNNVLSVAHIIISDLNAQRNSALSQCHLTQVKAIDF